MHTFQFKNILYPSINAQGRYKDNLRMILGSKSKDFKNIKAQQKIKYSYKEHVQKNRKKAQDNLLRRFCFRVFTRGRSI